MICIIYIILMNMSQYKSSDPKDNTNITYVVHIGSDFNIKITEVILQ